MNTHAMQLDAHRILTEPFVSEERVTDEERELLEEKALETVRTTPALRRFEELLLETDTGERYEHLRWIINVPTEQVVEWCIQVENDAHDPLSEEESKQRLEELLG